MKDNRINLLWVSSHPPYDAIPHAGGQTFNYYFREFLDDGRFNLRLICIAYPRERVLAEDSYPEVTKDIRYVKKYTGNGIQKLRGIINIESKYNPVNRNVNLISNYAVKEIHNATEKVINDNFNPDAIILEWTNIVVLSRYFHRKFPRAVLIASEHDVNYVGLRRRYDRQAYGLNKIIAKIRYRNGKNRELQALSYCKLILPQNYENIDLLVKDGIAIERLQWLIPWYHDMTALVHVPQNKDIIFFGAMGREENYLSAKWFIKNVMPLIKDLGFRFVVIGGNPPESLKKYDSSKIVITGFVDNIAPYFENALCFVAPLVLGAGIKVKVMEAMSSGIPVLTNNIGIEGIPATEDIDYIHCETKDQYKSALIRIMEDYQFSNYIGQNGKKLISETFSLKESSRAYRDKVVKIVKE